MVQTQEFRTVFSAFLRFGFLLLLLLSSLQLSLPLSLQTLVSGPLPAVSANLTCFLIFNETRNDKLGYLFYPKN
jgi:hypothetical protein